MITSPEPGFVTGRVQPILLPLGQFGELVCIAVVGEAAGHGFWARAVAAKPYSCLPGELGHALFSFGSLVSADFVEWCIKGRAPEAWRPPLGGLTTGHWTEVCGFDFEDVVRVSLSLAGLGPVPSEADSKPEQSNFAPRTSEEGRFLEAVRTEVARTRPGLDKSFRKTLSLTGKVVSGEIDFVGHHYVTCYAAVNPKGRAATRVQTASAALWRLARARDAFGFAAPSVIELTTWVPPRGMPIYSNADYLIVDETIAELRAQAQREHLEVFSVFDAPMACQRLIGLETVVTHQ